MGAVGRILARLREALSPRTDATSGEAIGGPSGGTGAPETSTNAQPAGASDEPWPGNDPS